MKTQFISELMRKILMHLTKVIPIILFVLALALNLWLPAAMEEFRVNIVTELIGAAITFLLVDILLRFKDEREKRRNEIQNILNIDNLLEGYIHKYFAAIAFMTTSDYGQGEIDFLKIQFKDLKHIFNINPRQDAPYRMMNFEIYFHSLQNLTRTIKQVLLFIDVNHHPDLVHNLQEFIGINDSDFLFLCIKERTESKYGERRAIDCDKELIANHTGPIDYQPSHAINVYIHLYKTLMYNIELLEKYINYMKRVK